MSAPKQEAGGLVRVAVLLVAPVLAAVLVGGWLAFGGSHHHHPSHAEQDGVGHDRTVQLIARLLARQRPAAGVEKKEEHDRAHHQRSRDEYSEVQDLTAPNALPLDVWTLRDESPPEDFAAVCLSEGRPRLIRNSPVKHWPALRRWASNDSHFVSAFERSGPLKAHVSRLPTVRIHSGVQPLGSIPGVHWHRPWKEELMSATDFMELSHRNKHSDETQHKFVYFFSHLDELPKELQADVGDRSFLSVAWRRVWETNLWMGGPLVRTPTHYDLLHNLYVQVQGHKRFRLYPPSQWPYLFLFPRLHPSSRMSQVDLDTLAELGLNSSVHYPDYSKLQPFECVLHPGDVLYIPPFWFHEVTVVGDDVSISVSVHTESDEVTLRDKAMQYPIPLEKEWPLDVRINALAYYLHVIFTDKAFSFNYTSQNSSSTAPMTPFIAEVVKNRYSHFTLDPWVDGLAEKIEEENRHWEVIERRELGRSDDDPFVLCLDDEELARHLRAHASSLLQKLGRWLGTPQAHIEMANWLEDVSAHLLGPLAVAPFLRMLANTAVYATC